MKYLFIFFGISIISCAKKTPIPEINEKMMVELMSEVYYLEAHFEPLNSKLKDSIVFIKFNQLLLDRNLSIDQFKAAEIYYNSQDEAYSRIQDGILKTINSNQIN